MRYGFKHRLNVADYSKNAAKNFSFYKLLTITLISIVLTIMLLVTSLQYNYQGKALLFVGIAFMLIFGYSILNIQALLIKIRNKK